MIMSMFPQVRELGWIVLAAMAALLFGFTAYYCLERMRIGEAARTTVAAFAFALFGLALVFWLAPFFEGSPTGLAPNSPTNHGDLRLAFFSPEKPPSEASKDNVYQWRSNCLALVPIASAPAPAPPPAAPAAPAAAGSAAQPSGTCTILIVWKRPIPNTVLSANVDGAALQLNNPIQPDQYIATLQLFGIPPSGILEISGDTKKN